MVNCPVCSVHVNSVYLRSESPKCDNGHDLGTWVHCGNQSEEHVYLALNGAKCPFCGNPDHSTMKEGIRVRCLFVNGSGLKCTARPFLWINEGPPCFMNHVEKMSLER